MAEEATATPDAPNRDAEWAGMRWIPGGRFQMGSDRHYPEERPLRAVVVDGFWMDVMPVTNARFARFVEDTGWVTLAERPADPADYPDADPALLVPASSVFTPPGGAVDFRNPLGWWRYVAGASWRHPLGPGSNLDGIESHPVVHVAWEDAQAFARWAGMDIPTEAEWECAARSLTEGQEFAWGDELVPGGRHMANLWQGAFPHENHAEDGWVRTSPVGLYPANGFGLHDMIGNVWEWTSDWWSMPAMAPAKTCCTPRNPRGGIAEESGEPGNPGIPRKVLKGGSHLCAPNYCRRYRPAARHPQPVDTGTSHIGFRCVRRARGLTPP